MVLKSYVLFCLCAVFAWQPLTIIAQQDRSIQMRKNFAAYTNTHEYPVQPQGQHYRFQVPKLQHINTDRYISPLPPLPPSLPAFQLSLLTKYQVPYGTQYPEIVHHSGNLDLVQQNGQRRVAPQIVQQQRNEGNFYRRNAATNNKANNTDNVDNVDNMNDKKKEINLARNQHQFQDRNQHQGQLQHQHQHQHQFQDQHRLRLQRTDGDGVGRSGYVAFEHKVFHVTTPASPVQKTSTYEKRSRRSFHDHGKQQNVTRNSNKQHDQQQKNNESKLIIEPLKSFNVVEFPSTRISKVQQFHDILLHYDGPDNVAFGHVELGPQKFSKRFESLNKGNRYRGEVIWADAKTGGSGSQNWDLAQGKL